MMVWMDMEEEECMRIGWNREDVDQSSLLVLITLLLDRGGSGHPHLFWILLDRGGSGHPHLFGYCWIEVDLATLTCCDTAG